MLLLSIGNLNLVAMHVSVRPPPHPAHPTTPTAVTHVMALLIASSVGLQKALGRIT